MEIDLAAARAFYQDAADGGNHCAQCRLAYAYEYGEFDLAIDLEAAREWCRRWRRVVTAMRNTNSAAPTNSASRACWLTRRRR